MTRFGSYMIVKRLAVGGTAEVFLAKTTDQRGRERQVVLKQILPQYASVPTFEQMFRHEARLVQSFDHPHVAHLIDYGYQDSTPYLTFEYVEGPDLRHALVAAKARGCPPTPGISAYIISAVADALDYAHQRHGPDGKQLHVVHRDVTPHNILLSEEGQVKLTDFGIARSALKDETTHASLKGKYAYMSPEQATPGKTVDARTDIFALGTVLYQMLWGKQPFQGETDVETLDRVRSVSIDLTSDTRDPEAKDLRPIVERCLARDPDDRYQSAAEIGRDLRAFLAKLKKPTGPAEVARWLAELEIDTATSKSSQAIAARALLPGTTDGTPVLVQSETAATATATPSAKPAPQASQSRPWLAIVTAVLLASAIATWWWTSRPVAPPADNLPNTANTPAADTRPAPDSSATTPSATQPDATPQNASPTPDASPSPDASSRIAVAKVRISSTPRGATVHIGKRRIGTTPLVISAAAKPRMVRFTRAGFKPLRLKLAPGVAKLQAPLIALKPGRLTANSVPWSKVYLDGKFIGNTPLRNRAVAQGTHTVELRRPDGRRLLRRKLQVRAGKSHVLSYPP